MGIRGGPGGPALPLEHKRWDATPGPVLFRSGHAPLPRFHRSSGLSRPFGEWNRIDVYATKDVLELYVNGIRQNRAEGLAVRSGPIALRLEGRPVEFRALWLRRL